MLYWICPECGGECSPAVRECPACAGAPVISPASVGPVRGKPQVTEEVLALVQSLQSTSAAPFQPPPGNGHSAQIATLALPKVATEELPPVPPPEAIESLVRPLIESTTLSGPAEPQPEPLPRVSEALELDAALVLDEMVQRNRGDHTAIQSIVASFQPTKTLLLAPAPELVAAPAPPCLQWMRLPRPQIAPVRPKDQIPSDLMSGLQTPTLAGPCVPRELRNLTGHQGAAPSKARRRVSLPAWTVSFLIALTLFLGVGTLLQYFTANRDAKAAAATSQPPVDQPIATAPVADPTASKLVEVTGLRIAAVPNNKPPQLAFLVVNHSATQLSNIGLQIAVRSASSSSGVAPLFRVSTTISSLGPYQSREFRAELDPQFHASEIPDWQSLRADVRVGAQ